MTWDNTLSNPWEVMLWYPHRVWTRKRQIQAKRPLRFLTRSFLFTRRRKRIESDYLCVVFIFYLARKHVLFIYTDIQAWLAVQSCITLLNRYIWLAPLMCVSGHIRFYMVPVDFMPWNDRYMLHQVALLACMINGCALTQDMVKPSSFNPIR